MIDEAKKYAKDERDRFVTHILEQYKITLEEIFDNPYLSWQFNWLIREKYRHPEF